jgi:hypothetical protein
MLPFPAAFFLHQHNMCTTAVQYINIHLGMGRIGNRVHGSALLKSTHRWSLFHPPLLTIFFTFGLRLALPDC